MGQPHHVLQVASDTEAVGRVTAATSADHSERAAPSVHAVAGATAGVDSVEPAASSLQDIRRTAESVVEAVADVAGPTRRTEDPSGNPASLAGGRVAVDLATVEASLHGQLRRLLLHRRTVRQSVAGRESNDPMLGERVLCDLVCSVALIEADTATQSRAADAKEQWINDAAAAVADSLSSQGHNVPASPVLCARLAQLVNVARGTLQIAATAQDLRTPSVVGPPCSSCTDAQQQCRRAIVAAAVCAAPPTEVDAFIRVWSAKAFTLDTTGLKPAEAEFVIKRFDLESRSTGRARLRLFLEAMRRNATLSSYVPPAEQQWASRCPFHTTPKTARMPTVTAVDRDVSAEWNVSRVLVAVLPCRWWPGAEAGSTCHTQFRILATDLKGLPLFVGDMRATRRDAFLQFLDDAPRTVTEEGTTPTFVGPPDLAGAHPRLMTVLRSYTDDQTAIVSRLHKPARQLAEELESVFEAVCDPPRGFGTPAAHQDAIRELANIVFEVFTANSRRAASTAKDDRRRRPKRR